MACSLLVKDFLLLLVIIQSCTIFSNGDRDVEVRILYPGGGLPKLWNPAEDLQVHVDINVGEVCYTGYHHDPVCKPLVEGAHTARVHYMENDPTRQHSNTQFITIAEGPHSIGTIEAWIQPSDMEADRSSAMGEVDASYLWVSAADAVEGFALNLQSMASGSVDQTVKPSLKKDKSLLLNHLVLALQDIGHSFTPQAFTCLARSIEDVDLVNSGESCFKLISGDLSSLSPQLNTSVSSQLDGYFDESTALTAHSLGLLDVLLTMCSSEQPTLILLVGSGLSNRMRAIVPALVFAKQTKRKLLIIWPLDPHCRALMSDLYNLDSLGDNVHVFEMEITSPPELLISIFQSESVTSYAYSFWHSPVMELDNEASRHVFVYSMYWLVTSKGDSRLGGDMDALVTEQLRGLDPSRVVKAEVEREMERVQQALVHAGEGAELVTVHVRMQSNMSLDVPSPLAHMALEMELLGETVKSSRLACSPPSMLIPMRQLNTFFRSKNKQTVFYVASDVPSTASMLSSALSVLGYEGRLCNSPHHLSRSRECMQRALVDQLLLAHTQASAFIKSYWSTYSELVQRTTHTLQIEGCGHYGSNATTIQKLHPFSITSLDLSNHMSRISHLRTGCTMSTCMLCFQFSDTRDQIAGVEALLFAMSGGAVIGAGFPFENWRVRVAMNSTEILSERGHLVLGLMRRSGMEVVPHLWDKDMGEYDCWLLRRLDSRLNIEDEACVAAWIASGIPSHELIDHANHLSDRKHELIGALRGVIKPSVPLSHKEVKEYMRAAGTLIHHSVEPQVPWNVWVGSTAWLVPIPMVKRSPMLCSGCTVAASGGWPILELSDFGDTVLEDKGLDAPLRILSPRHGEALWSLNVSVVVDISSQRDRSEVCGILEEVWGNRTSRKTCVEAIHGLIHFHVQALHCAEQRLIVSSQGFNSFVKLIANVGFVDRPSCPLAS